MLFRVVERTPYPAESGGLTAYLVRDQWNDWFTYVTQYRLVVEDAGRRHVVGDVKIGEFGQEKRPSADIPAMFDALGEQFFSLGQDDTYYENLNALGPDTRDAVLAALRDVAADTALFERAQREPVMRESLLRYVREVTVRTQFSRIARGDARLTPYRFSYVTADGEGSRASVELQFRVRPDSHPPTNIHVLVGRNGVGKTHLLGGMTRALLGGSAAAGADGAFTDSSGGEAESLFAGLVTVTFSAFDTVPPLSAQQLSDAALSYAYVGLQRVDHAGTLLPPKGPADLGAEFDSSLAVCIQSSARRARWRRALATLEADPLFEEAGVSQLLEVGGSDDVDRDTAGPIAAEARALFDRMSSGHKIVLLTITRLVELVDERTLVLLDEPESHLHPPLLAAFVRALSDLLTQRNGVALIATHSPVVVQEVPSVCVWKLRRTGRELRAERPDIETFGENVSVLTREIFRLEVTHTGFHRMLSDAVATGLSYEEVQEFFGDQLGAEADAIARALVAARDHSAQREDTQDGGEDRNRQSTRAVGE
jgi:ABC-type branched-subunit amino acid transport system ATPase component